jgi:hypothetical protein
MRGEVSRLVHLAAALLAARPIGAGRVPPHLDPPDSVPNCGHCGRRRARSGARHRDASDQAAARFASLLATSFGCLRPSIVIGGVDGLANGTSPMIAGRLRTSTGPMPPFVVAGQFDGAGVEQPAGAITHAQQCSAPTHTRPHGIRNRRRGDPSRSSPAGFPFARPNTITRPGRVAARGLTLADCRGEHLRAPALTGSGSSTLYSGRPDARILRPSRLIRTDF